MSHNKHCIWCGPVTPFSPHITCIHMSMCSVCVRVCMCLCAPIYTHKNRTQQVHNGTLSWPLRCFKRIFCNPFPFFESKFFAPPKYCTLTATKNLLYILSFSLFVTVVTKLYVGVQSLNAFTYTLPCWYTSYGLSLFTVLVHLLKILFIPGIRSVE